MKIKTKRLVKILRRLENSGIFWLSISLLGFFLFSDPIKSPSQSKIVLEQVRGGTKDLEKVKNFDPTFHRRLKQAFPDWTERMDYQKKQEEFYKSAMRKKKEIERIRVLPNTRYYTNEELDAIDYFHGTGIYATFQNPKTKPNIFDTRNRFLLKMHDDKLRNEFLNSLNSRNNKTI
ncbi:MAG: hypothetical protein ACJASR_002556 [Psychroserpens sp.]|jgi:hypothetical protein